VAAIRAAVRAERELPDEITSIEAKYGDKTITLADLRGFNFGDAKIGAIDLSYCSLDFADFRGASFDGTHVQLSSLRHALLDDTRWVKVQASPVDALGASLRGALIERSFLMHSDLHSVDFSRATLKSTRVAGCDLRNASLSTCRLENVDISNAELSDDPSIRIWLGTQDVSGTPTWFPTHPSNIEASPVSGISPRTVKRFRRGKLLVMVVDDSRTIRTVLKKNLQHEGYRVVTAEDGLQAVQEMRTELPDIVLVDIQMPHMDGYKLTRKIRLTASTKNLPVIVITGRGDQYRRCAMAAGANEFLTKPLNSADLMNSIRHLLPQV
jgi:CheY-like chemotaxis protein